MGKNADLIKRLFGRQRADVKPLPRASVEHNSVDRYQYRSFSEDSPRFRRIAVDEAPQVPPDVPDPDPIDFTTAAPEDIKAWQAEARAAKEARERAPEYDAWADLTRDVFYSYHHPDTPKVRKPGEVDPAVALHSKIMSRVVTEDSHAKTRNVTRDDPATAAMATMGFIHRLKDVLENELIDQARQSQQFEQQRDSAEDAQQELNDLRDEARELHQDGQPIPQELVEQIKQAVEQRNAAQEAAAQTAADSPLPMSKAAADAIAQAVEAAAEAATAASGIPSFGGGFGGDEPRYESPEQALDIADRWSNDETLKAVAELYGRMSPEVTALRAKRVIGGADEIVDLKFGDDLKRLAPMELASFADDDYEDDFYMRFLSSELLVYDTVGDENVAKGPMGLLVDESYSMHGGRNVLAKAIALCMLNVARREKRDFFYVGFSDINRQTGEPAITIHMFKANEPMDAEAVVDMCSHFFGGGTTPILAVQSGAHIMDTVREFKKADLVMVTDGEATFGTEDKILRDRLEGKGVRFHGIGIPRVFNYLSDLAGDLAVGISDFNLEDPKQLTAHLATHLT
jgi:uncharacterized protein with von Willebrand factor type A (vWA) domain